MTLERQAAWLCRGCAAINWLVSVRGIVDPVGQAALFGGAAPNYPFMLRLWSGFIFMFGCMFWETGGDLGRKLPLLKYNWIEKSITALAVAAGYLSGEVPLRLLILIGLTNVLFVPVLLWFDLQLRRGAAAAAPSPAP